jgi:periplasmic protein TonB
MKALASILALSALVQTASLANGPSCCIYAPIPHRVNMAPEAAEKMILHKADLACPKTSMPARFTGTVVVKVLIDTNGSVARSRVVSGPPMLKRAVLDAVRKYKYKPYMINTTSVEVDTTVSIQVDSYRDCHYK